VPASIPVAVIAYLIGSIPFSFLVARAFGVGDVRRVGSGNVGATNVLRSAGRTAGVLAFLLDAGKGAAATLVALRLDAGEPRTVALAAVMAVAGHMYPVWLRFQGGKGASTGLGAFAPLVPWAAAGALLAFALVVVVTRFASLGSIAGAVTLAGLAFAFDGGSPAVVAAAATAAFIVFRHRANLRRILAGTERRLGKREGATP
jgi:acyl phosphate:glycerol-3-phosphate acyltransferase